MPKRMVSQAEERGTPDADSLEALFGDKPPSLRAGIPPEVAKALDLSGDDELEWSIGKNGTAIVRKGTGTVPKE